MTYNEALNDVLEILSKRSKDANEELRWAKNHGDYSERAAVRRELSVIGELRSEIEGMKRTS